MFNNKPFTSALASAEKAGHPIGATAVALIAYSCDFASCYDTYDPSWKTEFPNQQQLRRRLAQAFARSLIPEYWSFAQYDVRRILLITRNWLMRPYDPDVFVFRDPRTVTPSDLDVIPSITEGEWGALLRFIAMYLPKKVYTASVPRKVQLLESVWHQRFLRAQQGQFEVPIIHITDSLDFVQHNLANLLYGQTHRSGLRINLALLCLERPFDDIVTNVVGDDQGIFHHLENTFTVAQAWAMLEGGAD